MLAVVLAAVAVALGYYASLKIWPMTYCRRCGGKGRNAGSNRKRFGSCRKCGGSGRKRRLGTRMLNRGGR